MIYINEYTKNNFIVLVRIVNPSYSSILKF